MERLTAIQQALEIIQRAQIQTAVVAPGAWQQLYRVKEYLRTEHLAAYVEYFKEAA
jgi:hypothetical protein